MDADPVADVLQDMDPAAPHAVAEDVAGMAVDDYFAGVHGVADVVLSIILHHDGGAVQESAQVVARHTINGDGDRPVDAVADEILAVDIDQFDPFGTIGDRLADLLVQVPVVETLCVYFHITTPGLRAKG